MINVKVKIKYIKKEYVIINQNIFFINCVWSNRNPNKESIIKVFSLIQFLFRGSDNMKYKIIKIIYYME